MTTDEGQQCIISERLQATFPDVILPDSFVAMVFEILDLPIPENFDDLKPISGEINV